MSRVTIPTSACFGANCWRVLLRHAQIVVLTPTTPSSVRSVFWRRSLTSGLQMGANPFRLAVPPSCLCHTGHCFHFKSKLLGAACIAERPQLSREIPAPVFLVNNGIVDGQMVVDSGKEEGVANVACMPASSSLTRTSHLQEPRRRGTEMDTEMKRCELEPSAWKATGTGFELGVQVRSTSRQ